MPKIFVPTLNSEINVSDEGRFELPSQQFSVSELRKVAREISKGLKNYSDEEIVYDYLEEWEYQDRE